MNCQYGIEIKAVMKRSARMEKAVVRIESNGKGTGRMDTKKCQAWTKYL
jgi:hypothetical protein